MRRQSLAHSSECTAAFRLSLFVLALALSLLVVVPAQAQLSSGSCARNLTADVAAIDQPYFWNRLGAVQPHGQLYALKRDIVALNGGSNPSRGNARLREEKRPRPLVLRMNVGDCLTVNFTNWLHPSFADNEQVRTRHASIHVTGMQLVNSINDDGSWVGTNSGTTGSLVAPGGSTSYTFYGQREGTYLLHNGGALTGGEGDNGTIAAGLFGALNVEPASSTWYRSQVTEVDFSRATTATYELDRSDEDNGIEWTEIYPRIGYNQNHPGTHPSRPNEPVLKILNSSNEIIYSDLTAIIVPANGTYQSIGVNPNRNEPFREFTIIFHDEIAAVQAFPHFYDERDNVGDEPDDGLAYTLHSVRDAFAINYGTGGIGSEILANRLGVGPMHDCVNCLYEEFFLSAWAVGDPAMVVDEPANAPCESSVEDGKIQGEPGYCPPQAGAKAQVALYPEDPSNVYHSYLNDHVKFRNLLAGSDDHHIFHLHAHQWLHTPDEDDSLYKDSQAIGQGTGFTYEIAHDGSGNRNKTPGDSIFHCHFYPHFAQGMWSMWRVHDVLETGTPVDDKGRPMTGARALPDGEIPRGTPIPGLIPLPGQPMAPPPSVPVSIVNGQVQIAGPVFGNPGYPFYIPGIAGQRVPEPPLDVYVDAGGVHHDGGLPRHIVNGGAFTHIESRLDFSKDLTVANAIELAEDGEPWEKAAMRWHADQVDGNQDGFITTLTNSGSTAQFAINGADPSPGAPFADPCYGKEMPPPVRNLEYFAADIQLDMTFNSAGWHFPQQRMLSLWYDVSSFLNGQKDPEPLFFRANTYDCVNYMLTNLVPRYYELDDFEVRTPTDILGQHIHLVKFDVTSSDGASNGFNYEDGTLAAEEVVHLIGAINAGGGILEHNGTRRNLTVENHPFFGTPGGRTTVQRWYVDDVLNNGGDDRTLRTVFTHDHFGPSTHQQVGLYAGLVTHRQGSTWHDVSTGTQFGWRDDGGPTSWQAVIKGPDSYREFLLEFGDFQHAYWPGASSDPGYPDPRRAINPPGREQQWDQLATKPWIYEKPYLVNRCPNGAPPPCPEAVSADDPGTMVLNYKNEPLALRVTNNPTASTPTQAPAPQGDLSYAFSSTVHGDPFTPILEAYEKDPVRIRVLVGAHEEEHNFSMHGARWLFEPDDNNSGYKASQMMGISEFYDFEVPPLLGPPNSQTDSADFLYKAGSSAEDLWNGIWGIVRVYQGARPGLETVDSNPIGRATPVNIPENEERASICRAANSIRTYNVVAGMAADLYPEGRLIYNPRSTGLDTCVETSGSASCSPSGFQGPLSDPTAIVFVHETDLDPNTGKMKPNTPREPLILRANAGQCIRVVLENRLPDKPFTKDIYGYSLVSNVIDRFNQNQVLPSATVGLHAPLVSYDILRGDGHNVGFNPVQTVAPGNTRVYHWYAGIVKIDSNGDVKGEPVEFGSIPLYSSDPIKHTNKGAVGALIIEPVNTTWTEYPRSRAKAIVRPIAPTTQPAAFREFVVIHQNDVNMYYDWNEDREAPSHRYAVRPIDIGEDPAETGQVAFNYATEPVWFRQGFLPQTHAGVTRLFDLKNSFANQLIGGDPFTPVFRAVANEPVRMRVIHPGGDSQNHTFGVHGHVWEEKPWTQSSTVQGANSTSEWKGVEYGHGPTNSFDILFKNGAGGLFNVQGDYLYRDYAPWYLSNGLWGLFRVMGSLQNLQEQEPYWNLVGPADPGEPVSPFASDPAVTPDPDEETAKEGVELVGAFE